MQGCSTIQENVLEVGKGSVSWCKTSPRTENQLRCLSYASAHCVAAGLLQIRARQSVIVVLAQILSMRIYYQVEEPLRTKPVDMYMLK
jgi:hypothetical protein